MKFFLLVMALLVYTWGMAQQVGIGITNPQSKLHIVGDDSSLLTLNYNNALAPNTSNFLYFKTGTFYTGAIATIGSGSNIARMGLYTFASSAPAQLKERISITDNGNVGIGIINPGYKFDVAGDLNVSGRLFVNGNAGTAGQVLQSAGASPAVWANAAGQYGFTANAPANQTVPNGTTDQELDFDEPGSGSTFENGDVFSGITNEFTAPVTGIYKIAASVGLNSSNSGRVRIGVKSATASGFFAVNAIWYNASSILTTSCFAIREVTAGTRMIVVLQNSTGSTATVYNGVDTYFSAVLVK